MLHKEVMVQYFPLEYRKYARVYAVWSQTSRSWCSPWYTWWHSNVLLITLKRVSSSPYGISQSFYSGRECYMSWNFRGDEIQQSLLAQTAASTCTYLPKFHRLTVPNSQGVSTLKRRKVCTRQNCCVPEKALSNLYRMKWGVIAVR
jgi:hypothetical protein